eukprot:Sdes_comp18970_c0_seq1m9499
MAEDQVGAHERLVLSPLCMDCKKDCSNTCINECIKCVEDQSLALSTGRPLCPAMILNVTKSPGKIMPDNSGYCFLAGEEPIEVTSESDWRRFQDCVELSNLRISATEMEYHSGFPNIVRIRGDLTVVNNYHLKALNLANLEWVGGRITISDNPKLEAISLPKLGAASSDVTFSQLDALKKFDISRLSRINGSLLMDRVNMKDDSVFAPLQYVGGNIIVIDNSKLCKID